MNKQLLKAAPIILAIFALSGCWNRNKLQTANFTVSGVSVSTLSPGDTTTVFGAGFGNARGQAFIGEISAQVLSWNNEAVRVKIPKAPNGSVDLSLQPSGCEKKFARKVALRSKVEDSIMEWVSHTADSIDGSKMEPLILVFKPVGPPKSGQFDYATKIPKSNDDLIDEVSWACKMGIQAVQLYFPGERTSSAEDYADNSLDNIRYIVDNVKKKCPDMIIMLDDVFMSDGNKRVARRLQGPSVESVLNVGSFQEPEGSDMRLPEIRDAEAAGKLIGRIRDRRKIPLPSVMTSWQAFDFQQMTQAGLQMPNATFLINMAVDKRAVDNQKTYEDIRSLLPQGSRAIAAVTREHVTQIIGYAITRGDHIAFGYHYATNWPGDSDTPIQSNLYVAEKILQTAESIKRPIATIAQAREMLGVKPAPSIASSDFKISVKTAGGGTTYVNKGKSRVAVSGSIPSNAINAVKSSYDDGAVWISTDSGVFRTEDNGASFMRISPGKYGVPTSMAATSDGAMWLGSPGYGILKTKDNGNSFAHYTEKTQSLLGDYITCMFGYDNEVYACVNSAAEGNPGKGIAYTTDSGENWYVWSAKYGLPFDNVRSIYVEDEMVYAGFGSFKTESEAAGLAISPDFGKTWNMVKGIKSPVMAINVWDGNVLLIGTKDAGAYLAGYDGKGVRPISAVGDKDSVWDISIDQRGWIWIVTDKEVLVSDNGAISFRSFKTKDGLSSTYLTGCDFSGNGTALISSKQDGKLPGGLTLITISDSKGKPAAGTAGNQAGVVKKQIAAPAGKKK